jgi:hypothetical protein
MKSEWLKRSFDLNALGTPWLSDLLRRVRVKIRFRAPALVFAYVNSNIIVLQ